MTNPIPTAIVGSSKAAYELFKPTKDSSGKTTTLAEQALNKYQRRFVFKCYF